MAALLTFFADEKFGAIIDALTSRGYAQSEDSEQCDILWTNLKGMDHDLSHRHALVNHFKGSQHFSNKVSPSLMQLSV